MMVEILHGAARCERVLVSRPIVLPKIEDVPEGMSLMVINSAPGKQTQQTLDVLINEGILKEGEQCKEIYDNIYAVEKATGDDCLRSSVSVPVKTQQIRVYFLDPSEVHGSHYGRCTPDGFACGIRDTDVWHKLLDGKTASNEFILTRSYHMDCEPDWTCSDAPQVLSPEQQNMLELGLPLSFGHLKDYARSNDEAVVGEPDSYMVEKDYDKELADLSSSTERLSLSRSSRPESMELTVREQMCSSSDTSLLDTNIVNCSARDSPVPGSFTLDEFETYWASNGHQILEGEWRKRYGEYMMQPATETESEVAGLSDDGISLEKDDTEPSTHNEDPYAEQWQTLWVEFATETYYALMNKLVSQDILTTSSNLNKSDISISSNEGFPQEGDSDVGRGEAGSDKEDGGTPSNKRPLSLTDFGISSSEGSSSIVNRYVKNHRLKKVKRESHNHKKNPNAVSADALEDGPDNPKMIKYWNQRYRLFRKFDEGIQMDEEGWFSVTPEHIAAHIACRLCPRKKRKALLTMDGFCGVGGNTIQLAMRSAAVLAVDISPSMISMAKNNAKVYGVERKIEFILADMEHFVPRIAPDAIFMSPPWGGPEYKHKTSFDLADITAVDMKSIFHKYETVSPNLAFIFPRNTKVDQLCELGRVEVEQNLLNKKVKTITAYYGDLICK